MGRSGVCTVSLILVCCIYTYLVLLNRGPRILLLQVTICSMRLRGLFPVIKQEVGLFTKLDGEGNIPQRIAG